MANFDFIKDERFRAALISDANEMQQAAGVGAWKAVHVLAGSIIEAVLIDYLLDTTSPGRPPGDPLKLDLSDAIDICLAEKILTDKSAALSHVIRGYRNLIHPGRVVRLSETVDENGARVALALTEMVVADVSRGRIETVGYTAEQFANKLVSDPSSTTILKHLIPRLNDGEKARLILDILPARYIDASRRLVETDPVFATIRTAYRAVLGPAPEELRKSAASWFAGVIRDEEQSAVHTYQEGFFHASELGMYAPADRGLAIDHLLGRMSQDRTPLLFEIASGVASSLTLAQCQLAVDIAVKEIVFGEDVALDVAAREWVRDIHDAVAKLKMDAMGRRLQQWQDLLTSRSDTKRAGMVADLFEATELPF